MPEQATVFGTDVISQSFFIGSKKVNCAAPFSRGERIVYGTDDGVYMSNITSGNSGTTTHDAPVLVLSLNAIKQIDVLEEYQLLIVLSDISAFYVLMDLLDSRDPMAGFRHMKRIGTNVSILRTGYWLNKAMVGIVMTRSTEAKPPFDFVKVLVAIDKSRFIEETTLRTSREFLVWDANKIYNLNFWGTKILVACSTGFENLDLESLDSHTMLTNILRSNASEPMAIFPVDKDFLLCYSGESQIIMHLTSTLTYPRMRILR
jgi:hypothetical protein